MKTEISASICDDGDCNYLRLMNAAAAADDDDDGGGGGGGGGDDDAQTFKAVRC